MSIFCRTVHAIRVVIWSKPNIVEWSTGYDMTHEERRGEERVGKERKVEESSVEK